ncbi:hypothetical protein [Paludisphaera borealis]|uniref:Uncharacterized protein n=1 Tax=Paludisphaera borealis TaxID=1387353 RepID=A0A1U7CX49_9BACT|nr:hypothetical protein [Paludisphaera borealis]APW63515.1 hypothetical protein BSF38_05087 [Paludisphaera borealis]
MINATELSDTRLADALQTWLEGWFADNEARLRAAGPHVRSMKIVRKGIEVHFVITGDGRYQCAMWPGEGGAGYDYFHEQGVFTKTVLYGSPDLFAVLADWLEAAVVKCGTKRERPYGVPIDLMDID